MFGRFERMSVSGNWSSTSNMPAGNRCATSTFISLSAGDPADSSMEDGAYYSAAFLGMMVRGE
jgi:hypothetical protein